MGERSRVKFIVIIALILTAAIVYSFSISHFQETPDVSLAELEPSSSTGQGGQDLPGGTVMVEVTPDTVQRVIGTLKRYTSYWRTVVVEYLGGGEVLGTLTAQVAVDDGWMRCDVSEQNGRTEHSIVSGDKRWLWYGTDRNYVELAAGQDTADLAQRLPTYEDVLALDRSDITAASYELRGDLPCIYVEVFQRELGYQERFWVSVESGLLVASETVKDGEPVYRMSSYEVESPLRNPKDGEGSLTLPDGSSYTMEGHEIQRPFSDVKSIFTLPDGTVLHQVAG